MKTEQTKYTDLELAADKYIMGEGGETQRMYGHHLRSFKAGAEWKENENKELKEQRDELLKEKKELLRVLYNVACMFEGEPDTKEEIEEALSLVKKYSAKQD